MRLSSLAKIACLAGGLAACSALPPRAVDALPDSPDPYSETIAVLKDGLASPPATAFAAAGPGDAEIAVELRGTGFAQVSGQPGKTLNERRLLAIRAARIEAMRDLAEQVHGLALDSRSQLSGAILASDHVTAVVDGEIRGARTLKVGPRDSDSFEVVLALSPDTVRYILKAARTGG